MSINAENIIGSYDIHSKQYILTFTNRPPAPVIPTDCSFSISVDKFVPAVISPLPTDDSCGITLTSVYSGPARIAEITGQTSANINTNVALVGEDNNFTGYKWEWTGGNLQGLTTKNVSATSSTAGSVTYGVTINDTYTDSHSINWTNPPVPVPVPTAPTPAPVAPVPAPVAAPVAPTPTAPVPAPTAAPVVPVPTTPVPVPVAPVPTAPVPAPVAPVPAPVAPVPAPAPVAYSGSISPQPIAAFTPGVASSYTISVTANTSWTLDVTSGAVGYFTVSPSSGSSGTSSVTLTYNGSNSWTSNGGLRLRSVSPVQILFNSIIEWTN